MVRFAAWIAWWIALFFLWLFFSGEWNRVELVGAAIAATAGATLAESVRAVTGVRVRLGARDLASAWSVPAIVLVDFGIVMTVLVKSAFRRERVHGRFVARDFDPAITGPSRAWRTYFANWSPNALVVDVDDLQQVVLFHDLVPFRKSEEPAA
jgi:hypothetical protein